MSEHPNTVSRVGEPILKRGPSVGSAKQQNQYEIRTTPLPAPPRGFNWVMCFGKQLPGGRFLAQHDGINKILAECWPDDEQHLTEVVDEAIARANAEEEGLSH